MILNILTFIVSVLALISSIQIGRKQYELSKWQAEAQNKVELYLLTQPITLKSADGIQPDQSVPAIYIRNVGGNVIYLERYLFNGREYHWEKRFCRRCLYARATAIFICRQMERLMFRCKYISRTGRKNSG